MACQILRTIAITLSLFEPMAASIAQTAPLPADAPLDEVVVTGEYAGPGMWKVTHPAHPGHELWIVGEPPPLPKRLTWRSKQVERRLLQSQEVLLQPSLQVKPDKEIGFFKGLTLVPGMLKARKNPDEGTLESRLPPELYQRWRIQKKRYLGRDRGIEKMRPIVAAYKLRAAAFDELGVREGGTVWSQLAKVASKQKIRVNRPQKVFTFPADEARAKIKQIAKEEIADTDCFAQSLALVEALSNKPVEDQRARAWATGDVAALASLPPLPSYAWSCISAVMQAQSVASILPADLDEQINALWVETAGELLAKNQSTLAVVTLSWWLEPRGLLERLRERGYLIHAPDDLETSSAP